MAFRTIFTQPGNATDGCPRCSNPLPAEDINVAADTVLCRKCGSAFSFSELLHYARDFNTVEPPRGISYEEASGGFIVTATTRSWAALFVVPFATVWCSLALGGIYGSQLREGDFNLLQSLFGIPFLIGSLMLISTALMLSIGVVRVRRDGDDGTVFTGIGPFGWTRRFQWSKIVSVQETDVTNFSRGRQTYRVAAINLAGASGPRQIRFGAMLSEERRRYLIWIIRKQITR